MLCLLEGWSSAKRWPRNPTLPFMNKTKYNDDCGKQKSATVVSTPMCSVTKFTVRVFASDSCLMCDYARVINFRIIIIIMSKIMERIVCLKITDHLNTNNILHRAQHGFLKQSSTTTNLLECYDWTICVQPKSQVAVVYIDFCKALDVISHLKLMTDCFITVSVALFYCG